ncbi:MAG: hypothetical protein ACLT9X_19875 [Parabacteroides merdae]
MKKAAAAGSPVPCPSTILPAGLLPHMPEEGRKLHVFGGVPYDFHYP